MERKRRRTKDNREAIELVRAAKEQVGPVFRTSYIGGERRSSFRPSPPTFPSERLGKENRKTKAKKTKSSHHLSFTEEILH
jgi:hypothetical protein